MRRTVSLSWLVSRKKFTDRNLLQLEEWLDADWESKDVDRDVRKLLYTLVRLMKGSYPRDLANRRK
jgi:hypothetical protein